MRKFEVSQKYYKLRKALTVSQDLLHGVVPRVDGDDQDEAHGGGQQGGEEEVGDGAEGDHSAHLGVEAGRARDQAGNHQGENHQLEEPHEELAGVGDDVDDELAGLIVTKTQTANNS